MSSNKVTELKHYRLLGRSGLRVSPLTLGAMTFGTEWGWGTDKDESRRVFELYVERGGNSIDTANFYTGGTSEEFLGEFIAGKRDRLVVATKYTLAMHPGDPNSGGNHRKSLVQSVEASLKRLKTDYIDLLWIHAWESRTHVDVVMRALDDMVRAGKVLYVGMSNAPAWVVSQANTMADLRGWTPFVGLQIHYNLMERSCERELVPMARDFGIGVLPWSPLAGGVLTGKFNRDSGGSKGDLDESLRKSGEKGLDDRGVAVVKEVQKVAGEVGRSAAQVAINWLLQKPDVVSPILGARTFKQLEDNLAALEFSLTDEQMTRLDEVGKIDLGYPHSYLASKRIRGFIDGGAEIE